MRRLRVWAVGIVAAVAWWMVGALPWVLGGLGWGIGGMRLPLQNLWRTETLPDAMPLVALPLSQYFLAQLLTMTTIGGIAAAYVSLLGMRGPGERGRSLRAALAGGLIGALAAIGQSWAVVTGGLEQSTAATLYVTALVGICLVGTIAGLASGAVLVGGPPALRAPAAAVASIAVGSWLGSLIVRYPMTLSATSSWLLGHVGWVSGLVLGVGLALTGLHSATRVIGGLVALGIAWIGPAAITALSYVGGSARALWGSGATELLDAGQDVFVAALDPGTRALGPYGLALTVGVLGTLWQLRRGESDAVPWSA